MSRGERDRGAALGLVAIAATALIGIGSFARPVDEPPRLSALGALPAGSEIVATIDVARLRQAGLLDARDMPTLGPIADCGFDPGSKVTRVAIALPHASAGAAPDFGIAASGALDAAALLACAERTIQKRGGAPAVMAVGSFRTVRDTRSTTGGEIAARTGGPVLLGSGTWLRAMIDAADGRAAAASSDELHGALRRAVGSEAAVVVSWTPEPGWAKRLAGDDVQVGLADDIRAAALAVDVASKVSAHGVIGCARPEAAAELSKVLGVLDQSREGVLIQRALGVPLLSRLHVTTRDREAHVELTLELAEAREVAQRIAGLLAPPKSPAPGVPVPTPSGPPPAMPVPDEVVAPPRGSGR